MGVMAELKKSVRLRKELLWLQTSVFLFNMGFGIIFPYLTLQMHYIGLTIEEISFINGICPAIIVFTLPLSGLLGDLFGYKVVMAVATIVTASASTCFNFIPRSVEKERHPFVRINATGDGEFNVMSLLWPLCSELGNGIDETNLENCQNSAPVNGSEAFFRDLTKYLVCDTGFNVSIPDLNFPPNFVFSGVENRDNGTFCKMAADGNGNDSETDVLVRNSGSSIVTCNIVNHPDLVETCTYQFGSHARTFAIYFALYVIYKTGMNTCFAIVDGTVLRMCRTHNSDYSAVQFYVCLAVTVSPFIASLTIIDPPEGSGGDPDYSNAFYAFDALLVLSLLVLTLKVDVVVEKDESGESLLKSIKKLLSPSAFIFLSNVFFTGILWGVHDAYLFLYLGGKRDASSSLLAYLQVTSSVSSLLVVPFAKAINNYFGHMNVIYFQIMLECSRFIVYSFVEAAPPYYAFGLFALDFANLGLAWVASITYGYKISDPKLAATMASIVNMTQYVLAKGISILVGGQFLNWTSSVQNSDDLYFLGCSESKTEYCSLFRITSATVAAGATVVIVIYFVFGRKFEEKLLKKLNSDSKIGDTLKGDSLNAENEHHF